jgi:hypothetical protein
MTKEAALQQRSIDTKAVISKAPYYAAYLRFGSLKKPHIFPGVR